VGFRKNPSGIIIPLGCQTHHYVVVSMFFGYVISCWLSLL
jgi:hypothetical protein